jgi:membrane-bound lytic murein transglycosylase D
VVNHKILRDNCAQEDYRLNFKSLFLLSLLTISGCKSLLLKDSDKALNTTSNAISKQSSEQAQQQKILSESCQAETLETDPQAYANIWLRIKHQLSFTIPDNRRLRSQKNWYSKHPTYMKRVTERASPYIFHIVEELEKHNLPLELALLPIVESAFDPFAYSHGRASGMWQFIPSTGKNFGLKQNWWYDGRRDVYLSTQGAIKFLKYLHKRFKGDWLHALAAYNSGEGNVRRAIRKNKKKNKPTDFWSLDLPKETQAYVPKLLALSQLLTESHADSNQWTEVANLPYFDRVATETQIDLSLAAALAEMSMNDFYQLNPAYNQWATAPKGPHYILLPLDKVAVFKKNLAEIPDDQRISYKRYTIKSGDSLIKIAKKFATTVELLKDNNAISDNTIRAGKSLLIPVASKARENYHKSNQQRLLARQNTQRQGRKINLEVKQGDSMWALAKKYKVNVRSLAKWNNIAPTDPLKIGQKLVVWTKQPQKFASLSNGNKKTKKIYYKVRPGDSLARVASKFNVSLNNMRKWNKKDGKKKYLQPGDSLMLYVDITRQY